MSNFTSLSALRKTELSTTIATQEWTEENFLSGVKMNGSLIQVADSVADLGTVLTAHQSLTAYTSMSVTNAFSAEVVDLLSNEVLPELETISGLVEEEVEKVDAVSAELSNYAKPADISTAIETLDGIVAGSAGVGKTLTSFSQTDGKVTAGFADIAITKSQVTDFPDIPLSTSQLINNSGYITSSYVSLSAVEKSSTLVLTEEQKAALVQASGMPAEAYGDFAISIRTSDGLGYIGSVNCFSAVQNENGDWVFVGGMPALNVLGWVANSTVIQGSEIHTILSVDNVSADIATKDELAGYLPLNGGGVVTGNVAIQNLDGDNLFSLNNYGKVTIGVGASIHPNAQYGVAIGANTYAANSGIAINGGSSSSSISANGGGIAIGDSVVSGGYGSIQLGYANNNSDALFRVWKYPMLDGNGDIPYGRLSANIDKLKILPISSTTDASINLTKNTYVYRVTDTNNTGTFPTLVAPTDIVQTGDYYFTFEIEWTTAASVGSYSGGYDWITYPEFAGDGSTYTYYITGRWDSSSSGGSAFTLNCWRAKKLTA